MIRLACLAMLAVLFVQPAAAECDIGKEARALNDRIFALRGPTREKQGKLATMYRTKMIALLEKRGLKGEPAKTFVAKLRERMNKSSEAKARELGNEELAKAAVEQILRISDLPGMPPEKACPEIAVIEKAVTDFLKRLATQLDEDYAAIEKILDEELAR